MVPLSKVLQKYVVFSFPVITNIVQVTDNLIIRGSEMSVRDVYGWFCHRWEDGVFSGLWKNCSQEEARETKVYEDMEVKPVIHR